jgi:hypothetical protein
MNASDRLGYHLVRLKPGVTTGPELRDLIVAEAKIARIVPSAMSERVLGSRSRVAALPFTKGPVRSPTVDRVAEWLDGLPWKHELEGLDALMEAAARERCGGHQAPVGAGDAPGSTGVCLTGPMLLAEIEAFLGESGMGAFEFATRALGWRSLTSLERVKIPGPSVVRRAREFIAKRPEPTRRSLTPSGLASQRMRDGAEDAAAVLEQRRTLTARAHETRAPGETLHDRVRRLAAEADAEIEAEGRAEAEQERRRDADELTEPSSLIRRAQREWPDQVARVSAAAVRLGVPKGEAWRRVIAAGIDQLTQEGGE